MGNMKCLKRQKIILVPYPAQGHVNPMLKLGSLLAKRCGLKAVLLTPHFIHHQIIKTMDPNNRVECISIADGLDKDSTVIDFFAIEKAMENTMPMQLEQVLMDDDESDQVVCVVVDLLASWAIEVARRFDVRVAGFWPAMLSTYRLISAIPELLRRGLISDSGIPNQATTISFLPNQPTLSIDDLPWLIGTTAARKSRFKFWTRTMERSRSLEWLLVNSFPEENNCINDDKQQINQMMKKRSWMDDYPLVLPIGPLSKHAVTKNASFWEEDESCLDWLEKQKPESVIYVSFGSWIRPIGDAKVKSLALALEASNRPFLWVLGRSWQAGLPERYLEKTSKQGKIVSWVPQMEVLQHKAVGCFLTHCGWNSTMEAIQFRKRLLCYPVAGDQWVNCAYIVELWKVGVKINGMGQREVEEGLKRVMEDNEMDFRLATLYEMTMGKEANSRVMTNLSAFCHQIITSKQKNNQPLSL